MMKTWKLTMAAAILVLVAPTALHAEDRPNILLVVADDMGYSDIGCYGGEIDTPNLDRLASNGTRFTRFYNAAICWPTRSSIMTGYYARQTGSEPNRGNGNYANWTVPLPKLMSRAGYRTYHSGKWHVQAADCHSAHASGFDRAYDFAQGFLYFTPLYHALDGEMLPRPGIGDEFFMDVAVGDRMLEFLDEHYREHSEKPFFAYMAFLGPHYPLKAPEEYVARYKGKYDEGWDTVRRKRFEKQRELGFPDVWELSDPEPQVIATHSPQTEAERREQDRKLGFEDVYEYVPWETLSEERQRQQADKMEIHAAMIDLIDKQVGRVVSLLEERGGLDNTLILFLSDNGASSQQLLQDKQLPEHLVYEIDTDARWGSEYTCLALGPGWANVSNTPMRRYKLYAHEGGTATPLIAHWPKGMQAEPGGFSHAQGHVVDFMPTFLSLAGDDRDKASEDAPPFPGESILPALAGKQPQKDFLYFLNWGNRALIKGEWKIVSTGMGEDSWELIHLESDRTETENLRETHPEVFKEMVEAFREIDSTYRKQGGYQ